MRDSIFTVGVARRDGAWGSDREVLAQTSTSRAPYVSTDGEKRGGSLHVRRLLSRVHCRSGIVSVRLLAIRRFIACKWAWLDLQRTAPATPCTRSVCASIQHFSSQWVRLVCVRDAHENVPYPPPPPPPPPPPHLPPLPPQVWYGLLFVRAGVYQGAIFKFTLSIPTNYPDGGSPVSSLTTPSLH